MKEYATTDFYTTAMLVYKKFPVIKITAEGNNGRVKRFHFEDTDELRQAILCYMNGQMEGNLRDFRNSIESIKDAVHT